MRPRTRDAVSVLVDQIGSSALMTSCRSMSFTGSLPNTGVT